MTILSLRKVVRERMKEGANAAEEAISCIRPIYGADEAARPMHIGTALLLELAEGPHIMTAAHVIDWADTTTLYLGLRTHVEVPSTFLTTVAPGGERNADVVDVAIAPFPMDQLGTLDGAAFYPEHRIGNWTGPSVGRSYVCIGYPNSQNRTPPRSQPNILRPRSRTYTSGGVDASVLPGRANHVAHLLVGFDFKHSRDMDGRRTSSGNPAGMSGGAMFDLGRLGDPATLASPVEARLSGMFIEAHRGAGVIMATRIAPALAWFRRTGALSELNRTVRLPGGEGVARPD